MPAEVTRTNPSTVRAPTGYSHAVQISGDYRRVVISGQVGVALDGTVPSSGEAQIAQAFANLRAVLAEHGMGVENVVKTTAFLTDRELLTSYRQMRGAMFPDHHPASTLLFVAGLADPAWVFEVEAEAVA
ncbi:MAG TPA: RidA family protein [Rhodopila sp.]|uniref:RidA family protein n=1 Tax=Rhodopila sp. TaxID=2480087 RepID=UPI002B998467|nr:RidA family protein [Rhodopila sp.]HVY16622.1 RidA family protein [Rhodopila sp.]